MENTQFNRDFQDSSAGAQDGMKSMMLISFLVNLIMSGAMGYMVAWINALQMILHLPMLLILIPANVAAFFSIILPVVQFDLLDPDWTTNLVFEFDDEPEEVFEESFGSKVFDQMKDLGYETHNSMQLLGSLFIFSLLWFVRSLLFFPVVKLFVRLTKKGQQYHDKLRDTLFYGEIIIISVESYIELLIAGYLNVKYNLNTTGGELFALWVSYYCLFMCLAVMPILSVWILTRDISEFSDEEFETQFGSFWDGVKKRNKAELAYWAIFMLRRGIFVGISFFMFEYPG